MKYQKIALEMMAAGRFWALEDGSIMCNSYGKIKNRKLFLKVGYPAFGTSWKNVKYTFLAHHIVWLQFNPDSKMLGMHINHKDNIRTNNNIANLELVTPKENTIHAFIIGAANLYQNAGENSYSAKINWEQALEIKSMRGKCSPRQLTTKYPLSRAQIGLIMRDGSFKLKHCPERLINTELYQLAKKTVEIFKI